MKWCYHIIKTLSILTLITLPDVSSTPSLHSLIHPLILSLPFSLRFPLPLLLPLSLCLSLCLFLSTSLSLYPPLSPPFPPRADHPTVRNRRRFQHRNRRPHPTRRIRGSHRRWRHRYRHRIRRPYRGRGGRCRISKHLFIGRFD